MGDMRRTWGTWEDITWVSREFLRTSSKAGLLYPSDATWSNQLRLSSTEGNVLSASCHPSIRPIRERETWLVVNEKPTKPHTYVYLSGENRLAAISAEHSDDGEQEAVSCKSCSNFHAAGAGPTVRLSRRNSLQ